MNPNNLPTLGKISNGDKDFYGNAAKLKDKNLLLIGFAEHEADEYVAKYNPKSIKMLTKWENHIDSKVQKYPLSIGDICRKTDYEDNMFDAVLTLSTLEHLEDLRGATNEMIRITKNLGNILHLFGPAWSCAYGHHIYAKVDDPFLNFSLWTMPAHMHLLCTQDEIVDFYIDLGYDQKVAQSVIHWFFETKIINRLFFDDYLKIFSDSKIQLDSQELIYNFLPFNHRDLLRSIYPGKEDFSTYGAKMNFIVNK